MNYCWIITGGSKGLGLELLKMILDNRSGVIINISRSKPNVGKSQQKNLIHIRHDLSKNQKTLSQKLKKNLDSFVIDKIIFINNAGIVEPIATLGKLPYEKTLENLNINLISPLIIINTLISKDTEMLIVNISSGAVNKHIEGWSLYSSSKNYILNILKFIEIENYNSNIGYLNLDPGVMNTDMQKALRSSNFKDKQKFIDYFVNGQLKPPKEVAENILYEVRDLI